MQILTHSFEPECPIDSVHPHPKNPNVGAIGELVDSIDAVGFYGAILCQRTHDDGSESRTILAGEHRWKGMKSQSAKTIPVLWIDCTDDVAERIVSGDNRLNRLGYVDDELQLELLQGIMDRTGDLDGTGFDDEDFERLVERVGDTLGEMLRPLEMEDDARDDAGGPSTEEDAEDATDEAVDEHEPADTVFKCGEYRWLVPRKQYLAWLEDIRQDVGFNNQDILAHLQQMLGLCDS